MASAACGVAFSNEIGEAEGGSGKGKEYDAR